MTNEDVLPRVLPFSLDDATHDFARGLVKNLPWFLRGLSYTYVYIYIYLSFFKYYSYTIYINTI